MKTSLAKLDENALENFVPIRTGDTFDGDRVEKTVESITFATGSTGYAFVDVNPRLDRNAETKTIDITFEVNEGPRVYVERMNIKGNTRTLDKVIRREVRIAEGDPFNRDPRRSLQGAHQVARFLQGGRDRGDRRFCS